MKLISIRLMASDIPSAISFWRDIMKLPLSYSDEAMGYAYFETKSVGIELFNRDAHAAALGEAMLSEVPTNRQVVITFQVDDVDTTYADLIARGATSVTAPQDRPEWYARTAHLHAHDAYLVEIYTRLAPPAQA